MTRVAVLERFAGPSRRYPAGRLVEGAEPSVFDLFDARDLLPRAPRAVVGWLGPSLPLRSKWPLLRACLSSRGSRTTPFGALVWAPEVARRIRAGEFDAVACFSTKDFPLAAEVAAATGRPCDELLARGTQYFGELAFELLAVIPYAYWLHSRGELEFTMSTFDTRCLYAFSPNHEEVPVTRLYVPITEYPSGEADGWRYDKHGFPQALDDRKWLPPPYAEIHRNDTFRWAKETCVVGNKTSLEAYMEDGRPMNSLDLELLLAVVGRLRTRYQVIYNRPRSVDIVADGPVPQEPGDIEAVERAYPDVLSIQELWTRHPELTFNELQLKIYANCSRFVSVLGGGSYLASYFGGTNVVYARRGWEVDCAAYENWFDRFSGARVLRASSPSDLLATIDRELM